MLTFPPYLPPSGGQQVKDRRSFSPTTEGPVTPLFTTLSRQECESVLLRNNVGRIAFTVHDRVNIVPVHYVFLNGWIYGRTPSSGKLRQILRNRRIVFEVDEHTELFDWQSVLVRGSLYVVVPDGTQFTRSIYRTAVSVIRELVPDAFTEADPVPFRDQLFRIRAVDITGRASSPFGGEKPVLTSGQPISDNATAEEDAALRDQVQLAIETVGLPPDADVQVDAVDGVIVLTGTVETSRDRHAIEAEILRIPAVVAVVQELETVLPLKQDPLPTELARSAIQELRARREALPSGLKVVVEHDWLRLEGVVQSWRQRDDAVRRLRAVRGARGVIDRTRIERKEA